MPSMFGGGNNPDIAVTISLEGTDQFKQSLDNSSNSVNEFSTKMGISLASLTALVTATFYEILKNSSEFDKAMGDIKLDYAPNSQSYQEIAQSIKDIAETSPINIATLAGAMDTILDLGVPLTDATGVLQNAVTLAAGSSKDLDSSVKLLVGSMKAYGDVDWTNINKYTDDFFTLVHNGVLDVPQLQSAMGKLIPDANSLGISFEEMAGGVQALSGVVGATQALNAMYQIIDLLIKPTPALAIAFADMKVATGSELIENMGGLAGALKSIADYAGEHNVEIGTLLGRKQLINDYFLLIDQLSADWQTDSQKLIDNAGAAVGGTKILLDNLQSQIDIFTNNINLGLTNFGNNTFYPVLVKITDFVNGFPKAIQFITENLNPLSTAMSAVNIVLEGWKAYIDLFSSAKGFISSIFGGGDSEAKWVEPEFTMPIEQITGQWDLFGNEIKEAETNINSFMLAENAVKQPTQDVADKVQAVKDQFLPLNTELAITDPLAKNVGSAFINSAIPALETAARTTEDLGNQLNFGSTYISEFLKSITKEDLKNVVGHFGELNNMLVDTGVVSQNTGEIVDQGLNFAMQALAKNADPVSLAITGAGLAIKIFGDSANRVVSLNDILSASTKKLIADYGSLKDRIDAINSLFKSDMITNLTKTLDEATKSLATMEAASKTKLSGVTQEMVNKQKKYVEDLKAQLAELTNALGQKNDFDALVSNFNNLYEQANKYYDLFGTSNVQGLVDLINEQSKAMEDMMKTLDPTSNAYQILGEKVKAAQLEIMLLEGVISKDLYDSMMGVAPVVDAVTESVVDNTAKIKELNGQITEARDTWHGLMEEYNQLDVEKQAKLNELLYKQGEIEKTIVGYRQQIAGLAEQKKGLNQERFAIDDRIQFGLSQKQELETLLAKMASGFDPRRSGVLNFYELSKALETVTGSANRFVVSWGDVVDKMMGDKKGFAADIAAAKDALEQIKYFKIDLDITKADEQINALIFKLEDYLRTLDPSSQAYKDTLAGINDLTKELVAAGGTLSEADAVKFNTESFQAGVDDAQAAKNQILAQIDEINAKQAALYLDITDAQGKISEITKEMDAVTADFENRKLEVKIDIEEARKKLTELVKALSLLEGGSGNDKGTVSGEMHTGGMVSAHDGMLFPNETYAKLLKNEYVLSPQVSTRFGEQKLNAFNLTGNTDALQSNKGQGQQPFVINIHNANKDTYVTFDRTAINQIYPKIKDLDYNTTSKVHFQ